jgi:hypothetical protein
MLLNDPHVLKACDMPLRRSVNATSIADGSVRSAFSLEVRSITVRYFWTNTAVVAPLLSVLATEPLMRKEDASRISRSA